MQLTKGAIGNLINRYKAVLKKCHLLNVFGSLAVAGMLVMGGAGVAGAEGSWTKPNGETAQWTNGVVPNGTVLQGTYEGFSQTEETLAGVATVDYTTTGVSVANGTTFTSNSKTAGAAGALKLLNGIKIGDNVTFTGNKATGKAWGGGAIYIKLTDEMQRSDNQFVTIGSNATFANNQAQTWGGAIALEYGNLTIDEEAIFEGNKTLGKNGNGEEGGGAIAVWHDPSNGEPGQTRLSVTKATFKQNSTNVSGGAIYNKDGNITITGSQFDQNSSGSMGGAIANMSGNTDYTGEINITDSGFTGNTAGNGGAVWNGTNGKVNITNSTFSKNTAMLKDHSLQQGGAITNGGEMTITGSTFEDNTANKRGGAIFNSGTLTVNGGSFDGNKAGNGGAIYNATNATLKITGTSFTNNTAAGWGGAILNSGATITVTDATFASNIAQGGAGGAIGNPAEGTSSVTVSGTKFLNNHSVYDGGAIGNYGGMKIENCLFEGNTAQLDFDGEKGTWTKPVTDDTAVGGGAISLGAVSNSAVASISGTTFKNNTSGTNGGAIATRQAIHADNSAAKLDIAATFIGNKAQQGGAIYNSFYTDNGLGKGAGVTVTGTFSGNEATSKGGAIYNDGTLDKNSTKPSGGVMTITDATFDNNKADFGGAIFNTGTLTINGGGFEGNTAKSAAGAIYNAADAMLTVDGVTFANNSSAIAGAINNRDGDVTITDSTFTGNDAGKSMGGAIRNDSGDTTNEGAITITGSTFEGNKAGNGGAVWNGFDGTVNITGSTFKGNTAVAGIGQGGAITNADEMTITGSTFEGNQAGKLGGAIFNAANSSITFNGTNTFTGNTAAGNANDIHNAGSIIVADGTTTLGSGLTQAGGEIFVNGGTLDMASGSSLSFDEHSTLTIKGGTFVADFGQLLTDYATTNTANGITDESIIGTSGNLNLRLNGGYYTLEQYNAAKGALLGQADVPEDATLNFLNANLQLEDDQALVVGAEVTDDNVTITMAPVVADAGEAPEDAIADGTIPSVPNQIVSVVDVHDTDKELLSTDSITVAGGSEFTAKGLQIDGTEGAAAVTLAVTDGSKVTLTGDEAGFTGVVNAEGDAVTTNVKVEGDAALTVGLEGNENAQNLVLNDVTVADGTFSVAGNGLDTTQVAANTLEVADASGTVIVDNASLTVENAVVENGLLSITDAVADLGTVKATGGVLFFDPSYGTIKSLANNELGSKLLVSDGSVVNVASGLDNLQELAQKAGFTTTADPATGGFILATGQSMLAVGQAIQLTPGGQIVVDAGVTYEETAPGSYVAKIDGNTIGDGAYFGQGSLLVVNGNTLNGATAAITLDASNSNLNVENGAKLLIADAVAGQKYTVISGATNTSNAFNNGAYADAGTTGWKGSNLLTSSDMLTLTSTDGTVFMAKSEDAHTVFPGLSHELATAVNTLYGQKLNDVDADAMGVRFLSRATDNRFLGADKNAAASTIESAARIAFAGAVPQMTKMASDAGSNAVVNRLGFANPADGAQAMNAEGKIVDRNTTGFALWIAPLWQSQHGWGMEADNLDYGFNGNLGGVSLGADYTFENAIRAGITFNIGGGYAESSGGDLNSTENRMSFWGLGAYAGWNYENFGLMADVSYTSTWNDLQQDMDSRMGMGDLEADVQASAISAGLRAEYKLETSVLDVIPHIGVRYMSLNTWGFDAESNGGTVLEGDGFHQDIWTFPVGVTFTKDFTLDSGWSFKPRIDFSVIPAAGDIKAKQDVAFTGLPGTYEVETQMMDYLTWQGGVGLELGNDTMSFGVNYTLQAGQHTTGHGVFGNFRYEF